MGGQKAKSAELEVTSVESRRAANLAFIANNRNENTSRTYASGWKGFQKYLEREGVQVEQVTEEEVADYLRVRAVEHRVAAATLLSDKAAITDQLRQLGKEGVAGGRRVTDMMAVLRRQVEPSRPKEHMSVDLMKDILAAAETERGHDGSAAAQGKHKWLELRNTCLILTMMVGMLREAEAVGLLVADANIRKVMVDGTSARALCIMVRHSKTDQAGRGAEVMLAENAEVPLTCPVRLFEKYMEARKAAQVNSEWLFPKKDGQALASSTPCHLVQSAVEAANSRALPTEDGRPRWGEAASYGSHSLRRGGVTAARDSGASMYDVQQHGRWKSLAVFGYVGQTVRRRLSVTSTMWQSGAVGQRSGETETLSLRVPAVGGHCQDQLLVSGATTGLLQAAGVEHKKDAQTERQRNTVSEGTVTGTAAAAAAVAPGPGAAHCQAAAASQASVRQTKGKRKRAHQCSDKEVEEISDSEEEQLHELLFMEEMNQGHRKEDRSPERKRARRVLKPTKLTLVSTEKKKGQTTAAPKSAPARQQTHGSRGAR